MRLRAGTEHADERLPSSFLETVRKLQPRSEEVAKKDVLILKGNEDILVPWQPSQSFVDELPKSRARVIGYDGVGHALDKAMIEDTARWIQALIKY